jgi:hypothetical protein
MYFRRSPGIEPKKILTSRNASDEGRVRYNIGDIRGMDTTKLNTLLLIVLVALVVREAVTQRKPRFQAVPSSNDRALDTVTGHACYMHTEVPRDPTDKDADPNCWEIK